MAQIKVPLEADYESIALAAGAEPGTALYWNDGTVKVPGVSQKSLDEALANYDHQAVLDRREAEILAAENKPTIEQEIDELKARITKMENRGGQ